jgi:hypothetical protein
LIFSGNAGLILSLRAMGQYIDRMSRVLKLSFP